MADLTYHVNVIADEAGRRGEDVDDDEYSKAIRLFRSLTGRVPDHYLRVAYGLVHNEDAMAVQAVVHEDELHIPLLDIPPTLAYSFTPDGLSASPNLLPRIV